MIKYATVWSAALLALAASTAHAGSTLVSPPYNFLTKHDMYCTVRNIGSSSSIRLRIEARGDEGDVKSTSGDILLPPGKGTAHLASVSQSSYCAFVVLSGNKKNLRAAAMLSEATDNNSYVAAIPAE